MNFEAALKVLHLCSYYDTSKVYLNSFEQLDMLGVEQTVFVANKKNRGGVIGNVIYSPCLKPWMKVSLFIKTLFSLISIIRVFGFSELKTYDLIHCHTLFSDGFLGLILSKLIKVPFIITVRNTDFNSYMRFFYHLRLLGKYICTRSELIIFVSNSYYEKFSSKYSWMRNLKSHISYNGVDNFWIEHENRDNIGNKFELLTIGYFDKNKNLGNAYLATEILWSEDARYHITIVGGTRSEFEKTYNIKPDPRFTTFKGVVKDRKLLRELYAKSGVFILPSYKETFGLVYIEALSQGCNIVCSKGEGISGLFPDTELSIQFCQPNSPVSIARSVRRLNSIDCKFEISSFIDTFCWKKISLNMLCMYNNAIDNR